MFSRFCFTFLFEFHSDSRHYYELLLNITRLFDHLLSFFSVPRLETKFPLSKSTAKEFLMSFKLVGNDKWICECSAGFRLIRGEILNQEFEINDVNCLVGNLVKIYLSSGKPWNPRLHLPWIHLHLIWIHRSFVPWNLFEDKFKRKKSLRQLMREKHFLRSRNELRTSSLKRGKTRNAWKRWSSSMKTSSFLQINSFLFSFKLLICGFHFFVFEVQQLQNFSPTWSKLSHFGIKLESNLLCFAAICEFWVFSHLPTPKYQWLLQHRNWSFWPRRLIQAAESLNIIAVNSSIR